MVQTSIRNNNCIVAASGVLLSVLAVVWLSYVPRLYQRGETGAAFFMLLFAALLVALIVVIFKRSRSLTILDDAFKATPINFPMFSFRLPFSQVKEVIVTKDRFVIVDNRGKCWYRGRSDTIDNYGEVCAAIKNALDDAKVNCK